MSRGNSSRGGGNGRKGWDAEPRDGPKKKGAASGVRIRDGSLTEGDPLCVYVGEWGGGREGGQM